MKLLIDNSELKYSNLFYRWLLKSLKMWLFSLMNVKKLKKVNLSLYNKDLTRDEIDIVYKLIIENLQLVMAKRFIIIRVNPMIKYKNIPLSNLAAFIADGCLGSSKYNLLPEMFKFVATNITKLNNRYKRSHGLR